MVAVAFVVATVGIWAQRLVNLAGGDEGAAWARAALAVTLVAAGVAAGVGVVVMAVRSWPVPPPSPVTVVWRVAAGLTVAVWVVRGVQITLDWRSVGFVAVHLVLAAVSMALAWGLWRAAGARH